MQLSSQQSQKGRQNKGFKKEIKTERKSWSDSPRVDNLI